MRRTKAAVAATALAGLLLAGCGSDGDSSPEAGKEDKSSGESTSLAKVAVPAAYVNAVDDDGTVYGTTDADTSPVVELNMSASSPKILSEGTVLPAETTVDGAMFIQRENGAGLRISVRQKR